MPRVDIQRMRSLPDIIATNNYEFIMGTLPGGSSDRQMVLKCFQAVYPGTSVELMDVPIHGFVFQFRGRRMYPRQLQLAYYDDASMDTTTTIETWLEYIAGTLSGVSQGPKSQYASNSAQLYTYDGTGTLIKSVQFFGLFAMEKTDIQYDSTSSTPMTVQLTMAYDYVIPSGININ